MIAGNAQHGVFLQGASDVVIRGNYIGLAGDGSTALGNAFSGILASAVTN